MTSKRKYTLVAFLIIVMTAIGYPIIRNATAAEGTWQIIKNAFGGRGDMMTDELTLRGAVGGSTLALRSVVNDSTGVMRGFRYLVVTISPTTKTGHIHSNPDSTYVRQISIRGWTDGSRTAMVGFRTLWNAQKVCNVSPQPIAIKSITTGWYDAFKSTRADSCTRIAYTDSTNIYPYFDIYSSGGSTTGLGAKFKVWVTGYND